MAELIVRSVSAADRPAVDAFLADNDADAVARLGEMVDAREQEALLAEVDGRLAGVATMVQHEGEMELLTLHATERHRGVGTALLTAVVDEARARGCHGLWLITTNDNVDALRFYQRRGLRLARLHAGAVDVSRAALKPWIPETGDHGIPIRDEIELEIRFDT
jgi:ribosomal protein S18 acetylase RimI-like enzyme